MKQSMAVLLFGVLLFSAFPALIAAENVTDPGKSTAVREKVNVTVQERLSERQVNALGKAVAAVDTAIQKMVKAIETIKENGANVTGLEARVAMLQAKKAVLANATSIAEAREALQGVREDWKELQSKAKEKAEEAAKNKTAKVIERAKGLFSKLDKLLNKMEAAGVDVSGLRTKLGEIKATVSEAEGKYGAQVKEAAHLLKEANKLLADFKKDLKEKAGEAAGTLRQAGNKTDEALEASVTPTTVATSTPEASANASA